MSVPLIKTKLYIPLPRPDLVARPRLLARLTEGVTRGPGVTLISAPAGFGKTTLVSAWLAARTNGAPEAQISPLPAGGAGPGRPLNAAWLSLEPADNDPTRFLTYLLAAIQEVDPALGKASQCLLQASTPALPPLEALLAPLINDLATLTADLVLVLDDYHLLETSVIHQAVAFLVDHRPPHLHLFITSRSEPADLPLARWRARSQLLEVGQADLRFNGTEAATFLNEVRGLHLSAGQVDKLEARTEGWITGLQLAALSLQGRPDSAGFIETFTGDHRFVLDYLVAEVLAQQPSDVQRFLLLTSILSRVCAPLGEAVLGPAQNMGDRPNPPTDPKPQPDPLAVPLPLLEQLARANLFITPLDEVGYWYRYHPLFAEALRGRLRQLAASPAPPPWLGLSGDEAELHRRAAGWYEQQALVEEAMAHWLLAPDFAAAARLLARIARPMWMSGELTTLQRWFKALPEPLLRARPQLCLFYAWVLLPTRQFQIIETWLEAAEQAAEPFSAGLAGEIATLRSTLARMQKDADQTIVLAHQALAQLPPDDLILRSAVALNLGHGYRQRGDLPAAEQAFSEAKTLSQAAGNLYVALLALSNLGGLQAGQGRLAEAATYYRAALQLATDQGAAQLPVTSLAHIGLGKIWFKWHDLDAAAGHLSSGLERAEQGEYLTVLLDGYLTLAQVKRAQADEPGAEALLEKAEQLARHHLPESLERITTLRLELPLAGQTVAGPAAPAQNLLSERELEVLAWVAAGASNQDIAQKMVVTIHTVKKHVSHILQKLEVTSRTQAAAKARQLGLIE
ncbi:MAG TPA: LuxR C-terminal-related transcriptional regulator [Anaerolineae bacterium]|mgnify:CR=1 FL=1|nr:LuxR C-terminal-related transcriptional regulator [Anaerolineae bacterium]